MSERVHGVHRIYRVESSEFKETEIGLIPKDWEVVRLGEVANISAGGSAPQGEKFFNGNNPFIRVQHIDNESYKINNCDYITDEAVRKYRLKLFPKGTIVFPKSGATIYLEKRAMLPFDSYIVSHLCAVNSKIPELSQEFLFYALIKTKFAENKGDGYPTLNLSEVKNFKLPLPPLSEQKAIAYVLSTIQEAIEKTEQVIKATKELKKSLMKHLFTYGPVSLEDAQKVELKETEIGLIPKDWEVVRLGEVIINDSKDEKFIKMNRFNLLPFIPMSIIPENSLYITEWEMRAKEQIRSGIIVQNDDLLIAKITPSFENGKQGIVKGLPYGWALATTEVIPVRVNNKLCSEFIAYYLRLPKVRYNLASKMEGTTGRQRLPKSQLVNLQLPIPPLHIQQQIAEILKTVDDKIQAEENKKKALESFFKSMLHNLMTGRIRVDRVES
ncbi:restriction endonuclease subunit S [Thermodesulfovibrio sp. TK110]